MLFNYSLRSQSRGLANRLISGSESLSAYVYTKSIPDEFAMFLAQSQTCSFVVLPKVRRPLTPKHWP